MATDFEDAVRLAVTYGGDSDTLGAIAGSLAEARFEVPERLISRAKAFLPDEMLVVVDKFENLKLGKTQMG